MSLQALIIFLSLIWDYVGLTLSLDVVLKKILWIGASLHNCLNFYRVLKTTIVFQSLCVPSINVQKSEKFAQVVH